MERRHEEYEDRVAAYVLGAIPPDELAEVADHISSCPICMEEARAHSAVLKEIELTVEPVPVPTGFADDVVAKAHRKEEAPANAPESAGAQVLPFRRRVAAGALAAAAAVVVGVLGAGYLDVRSDLERSRQVIGALTADRGLPLSGTRGAKGQMVPTRNGALFVAARLPEPPDGRTYQLWALRNDKPLSLGTFDVEEGEAVVRIENPVEGFDAMAVTVEPAGGSEKPSTDPVMRSA